MEKVREFQKNIYFCLLILLKYLTVWITTNWKILKEIGILDHLIRLLRNLYANQEATVRTGHGTTNWFQIGIGEQGCILSPCLFNFYADIEVKWADDNIHPWYTLFPILNQSIFPCPVLTVASLAAYRFLTRQVIWSGIPISLRIFHSLLCPQSQRL